ncbi:hypothetical protein [Stutzerimonas stutzeri]|uniref:Uncharacterized protein n=1 Tax=Stutzerimonas stutzeri TaxID=316 RepID=A0A0D9ARG0_STUST|nr:hypothetical protein [Stutzerimonas stutzeri]KJH83317.1 hypothetical protein UF78_04440 [Stutzerimonas stutzeri]
MKKEFWATSKSAKIMQIAGWVFILVLPVYGVTKVGLGMPALMFIAVVSGLPGVYFLHASRKLKTEAIILLTDSDITIRTPLNKTVTVPFSEICTIKEDMNQGVVLKGSGRFKVTRIPAKMLSSSDRADLIYCLNSSVSPT